MNHTLPLDILSCIDLIYGRMQNNYSFAFIDNKFEEQRAHPILCRFTVFNNNIKSILSKEVVISPEPLQDIYFKQVIENLSIIQRYKEWAYPNNSLNNDRIYTSLNCIESSIKNYNGAIKLLGNYCLNDKYVDFNLMHFVSNISCSIYFNYAYPDEHYSESKSHPTFQMLLTLTENISYVVNSLKTEDVELQSIISTMTEKLKISQQILIKAYPDNKFKNSIGHSCLSQFMTSWLSFKESSLTSLKNHFEKKQLIKDYEAKLDIHNELIDKTKEKSYDLTSNLITNTQSFVESPELPQVSLPIVKKIKSLL